MLLDAIIVLVCGVLDRVRGGFPSEAVFDYDKPAWIDHVRLACKFLYGAALVSLLSPAWYVVVLAGLLWWVGTKQDFGSMFRVYRDEPGGWINAIRVGFVWALPTCLALAWVEPRVLWLFPASVFGTYVGHLIASRVAIVLPQWALELETGPAWSEFYRGLLIAGFLVGVSHAGG